MGGMVGSGMGYQRSAMSGFARLSAQEQQRETANKQMEQASTNSAIGMGVSAASMIATIIIAAWPKSDERLKNICGEFVKGIAELAGINPITFQYNELSGEDQEPKHSGFSAQNLLETIPEAVILGDDGYYRVDPMPIIAALVNSVNHLQDEIDQLKILMKG